MKKFRLFFNAQKEETWLNRMLEKGWLLKKVNVLGVYTFKKTPNHKQVIRLDCQSFSSTQDFEEYKTLYEDFGWIHVKGSRYSTLQYWLNPNSKDDLLFSDKFSEKHYLKNLSKRYLEFAFLFLFLTFCFHKNSSQFVNIKAAYYTLGLWEMNGSEFWRAFIFETPFAFLRFGSPWIMLIFSLLSLNSYFKYKKAIDKPF